VENASYPVGLCAERCALAKAVVSLLLFPNSRFLDRVEGRGGREGDLGL